MGKFFFFLIYYTSICTNMITTFCTINPLTKVYYFWVYQTTCFWLKKKKKEKIRGATNITFLSRRDYSNTLFVCLHRTPLMSQMNNSSVTMSHIDPSSYHEGTKCRTKFGPYALASQKLTHVWPTLKRTTTISH